jgi:hypothetical protein
MAGYHWVWQQPQQQQQQQAPVQSIAPSSSLLEKTFDVAAAANHFRQTDWTFLFWFYQNSHWLFPLICSLVWFCFAACRSMCRCSLAVCFALTLILLFVSLVILGTHGFGASISAI